MIAEVKLYWVIYQMTSASPTSISRTNRELLEWQNENATLFGNFVPMFSKRRDADANLDHQTNHDRNFFNWGYISRIF
jgi:hypothetical protein